MFSFETLIALLIPIAIFYFTFYINMKGKLEELEYTRANGDDSSQYKIHIIRRSRVFVNIIAIVMTLIVMVLYFWPSIMELLNCMEINITFDIKRIVSKILPFKKGFFANPNFKFSYITGLCLSLILEIVLTIALFDYMSPYMLEESFLIIMIVLVSGIGLLWLNNYVSLFLVYCIMHFFALLSIVLNIVVYGLLLLILILVLVWIFGY